jgi:hypothetical protein
MLSKSDVQSKSLKTLGYVPQELPRTMTEQVIEQVIDIKEEPYN